MKIYKARTMVCHSIKPVIDSRVNHFIKVTSGFTYFSLLQTFHLTASSYYRNDLVLPTAKLFLKGMDTISKQPSPQLEVTDINPLTHDGEKLYKCSLPSPYKKEPYRYFHQKGMK